MFILSVILFMKQKNKITPLNILFKGVFCVFISMMIIDNFISLILLQHDLIF